MIASQHTQSLTGFRQKANETLERLNQSGEAEILTVNGEARAVLLSPAVYDELTREVQLTRDVITIRRAMQDIDDGKGLEAGVFLDGLRKKLHSMKARSKKAKPK